MNQPVHIMPCLDVQNGPVVKGVHSGAIRIGEPKLYRRGRAVPVR